MKKLLTLVALVSLAASFDASALIGPGGKQRLIGPGGTSKWMSLQYPNFVISWAKPYDLQGALLKIGVPSKNIVVRSSNIYVTGVPMKTIKRAMLNIGVPALRLQPLADVRAKKIFVRPAKIKPILY